MSNLKKLTNERPLSYGAEIPLIGTSAVSGDKKLTFCRLVLNDCKEVGQDHWRGVDACTFHYRDVELTVKKFLLEKVFNSLQHKGCAEFRKYIRDLRGIDFGFKSEPHPTLRTDISYAEDFQTWLDELERITLTFRGRILFYGQQIENRYQPKAQ